MRVRVSTTGLYAYPDVVVACGPQFLDDKESTLLNPTLIVEVLSPTTEAYDRGLKFKHYSTIETLREYLLIASESVDVELRTRQPDGRWILTSADRLEDSIELQSIGCRLALADLYEKVEFGERGPGMRPLYPSS
jgi:Uma2 family endonuclease